MSYPSSLQQALYAPEGSWCEAWGAPSVRLQLLAPIDTSSLGQKMLRMDPTKAYLADGMLHRALPFDESTEFTFEVEAGGHGTAPTGALSATQLYTLLALLFGGGDATSVGTTATGGTAVAPTVAGGTFPSGCLCRIGTNNPLDARGNGEAMAVSGLAAGTLTLFGALAGAPTNGDIVYSMLQVYPLVGSYDLTSTRWLITSPGGVYRCRGCYPKKIELTGLNPAEPRRWKITMGTSLVEYTNTSFPDATAPAAKTGDATHSLTAWINTVGTSTRAIYSPRECSIEMNFSVAVLKGGQSNTDQVITGVKRTGIEVYVNLTLDKDAAGTDAWSAYWVTSPESQVYKRMVLTPGRTPGRALAISLPKLKPAHDWARPTWKDLDGLTRVPIRLEAEQTGVTTTPLTQAPIVIGIG